ncbi:hypothetical protein BR93DRAFT_903281, partial [Coniochaeta sp. PMI_546]
MNLSSVYSSAFSRRTHNPDMEAKIYLEEACLADIPEPVVEFVLMCLTIDEAVQICEQFQGPIWRSVSQVMWTGILPGYAQGWADKHALQTLTTAMGRFMDPKHPSSLKRNKSMKSWSKYVKGASALFACHISRGKRVVVLSPPPPERFHPSGGTNYQAIEEPILKGGDCLLIELVHPTVRGAESFSYQIWPVDMTCVWVAEFGNCMRPKPCWKPVKTVATVGFKEGKDSRQTKKAREENREE